MKKTTQELIKYVFQRMNFNSNPIIFWNYTVTYDYPTLGIKKFWREVGVVVEGEIYINNPIERFLFGRAIEKNLGEITVFLSHYIGKVVEEKEKAVSQNAKLTEKITELEGKLAQSVANNIDLSPNSELDD